MLQFPRSIPYFYKTTKDTSTCGTMKWKFVTLSNNGALRSASMDSTLLRDSTHTSLFPRSLLQLHRHLHATHDNDLNGLKMMLRISFVVTMKSMLQQIALYTQDAASNIWSSLLRSCTQDRNAFKSEMVMYDNFFFIDF